MAQTIHVSVKTIAGCFPRPMKLEVSENFVATVYADARVKCGIIEGGNMKRERRWREAECAITFRARFF